MENLQRPKLKKIIVNDYSIYKSLEDSYLLEIDGIAKWIRVIRGFKLTDQCKKQKDSATKFDLDKYVTEACKNNCRPDKEKDSKVEYEKLEKCVMGLGKARCESYESWIKILFAIFNVSKENNYVKKGASLIHEFSSQSSKYNEVDCDKVINKLKYSEKGIAFGSLMNMLKEDNPALFSEIKSSYAFMKSEFEKTHFKVVNPVLYCQELADADLSIKKKREFIDTYDNLLACAGPSGPPGKSKSAEHVPFTSLWMKDPKIRVYDRIDFLPNCGSPTIYNLFTGFDLEKYVCKNEADVTPILNHMKIMVNHDEKSFDYFTAWLAQIIQEPNKLSGTSLVFKSKQGAGKNMFCDWFGKDILGEKYYYTTADINHLFGRFASGFKNRLLVNLDETSGKDTFLNSEKIKNRITCETMDYEKKGFDAITLKNFARILFTTNNDTPIKVEQKDRRLVLFECSNEKCIVGDDSNDNAKYFNDLKKTMQDKDVQKAFYDYLKGYDISKVNFIKDRPITAMYKDVQEATIPIMARFLESIVFSKKYSAPAKCFDVFNDYLEFIKKCNLEMRVNSIAFGREITKYKGIERKRSNGSVYSFDKKAIKEFLISQGYIASEESLFIDDDEADQ